MRSSKSESSVHIEVDDVTRPQVLALLEEHLRNMYDITPPEYVFAFDANKLRAPGIVFWTAWEGDTLLGCAALKELSPTQGEVKSMRTPANLRRRGAGRALLMHLLGVARERGYRELFLETGRHQAFEPAHALYRSVGFQACGPFADYEDNGSSVFMSLRLVDTERPEGHRDASAVTYPLLIEFQAPTRLLRERDRSSDLPIVGNGPPGTFVLFADGVRISLPTDQIVFADDSTDRVCVAFGGMEYAGIEDGQLVCLRVRELQPEHLLSPYRSHRMELDTTRVASVFVNGRRIWTATPPI